MIIPGQLVMLISPKGKRYFRKFDPAASLNTHDGRIEFAEYEGIGFGEVLRSHLGKEYRILKPTLYDLIKSIKRKTQIIYPKEIGYILLKLGIGPGTS
ncbi:MAG: tRNA (adenine-N1)-methyltransferase, partial [Desulfovibrionales bacterium]